MEDNSKPEYEMLVAALREVFGEAPSASDRFVNVSRIPLLCASVLKTEKSLEDISKTLRKDREAMHKSLEEMERRLERRMDERYVTKDRFEPVRMVVYGGTAVILLAVVGAILSSVIV